MDARIQTNSGIGYIFDLQVDYLIDFRYLPMWDQIQNVASSMNIDEQI